MDAHPNSPDGCFERHGYTIVRTPSPSGNTNKRVILDPQGNEVLRHAGYEAETAFCRERGLMI